ncbi:hypothetical protein BJV74DRAFT_137780 [Russula compacta]|nr:hypothetical protein BJV74DRAFT_137780 [Russula compacta]
MVQVRELSPQTHLEVGIAAAAECADPYPCPTVPAFGLREIRERVVNWQADVLSPPLSQSDNQDPDLNQLHVGDANQPSPLNFPVVKQRRCEVPKAVKCKNNPLLKGHSTSRFFRGTEGPKFPDGTHHDAEGVTTSPSEPRGSAAEPESNSWAEVLDEDPKTARRCSPTHITMASRENIQQVSELFLPPSFPSYLRTSTPPPLSTSAHLRLAKPPEIPRTEDLCTPASLNSPPPFPPSQAINGDLGSRSQLDGSLPINRKRPLQDTPSPPSSPNRLSKRQLQSEKSTPAPKPTSSFGVLHAGARRSDLDLSSPLNPPGHVPVIDLRQLVSSQRSRAQSRHSAHGINALT